MAMAGGDDAVVNDAAVDYHGKTVATAMSDGSIRIGAIENPSRTIAVLFGHNAPVWQVAWAHPKFGNVLASCSFDQRVIIWKETGKTGQWSQIQVFDEHKESVNSIDWAPHELGLVLACGSSDGCISVFTARQGNLSLTWDKNKIETAHAIGVTAVSWAPAIPAGALVSPALATLGYVQKLASCGCDNTVKVWKFTEGSWKMDCHPPLSKHSDWVRDIAWAPNLGLPKTTMASASQDGTVVIWTQDGEGDHWHGKLLHDFKVPVWRVRWSPTGDILAVTDDSADVSLWKEVVDGEWTQLSSV